MVRAVATSTQIGSVESGSHRRSRRSTARLGISAHRMFSPAHCTLRVCRAEKPAVAKKLNQLRSITNHWVCFASRRAYLTKELPFAASSSPCAETTAVDGCGRRVWNCAE